MLRLFWETMLISVHRPNSNAVSLGEVKKGTLVHVLGQAQGWCRLEPVAGTAAWIHQDFERKYQTDVPASFIDSTGSNSGPSGVVIIPRDSRLEDPQPKAVSLRGVSHLPCGGICLAQAICRDELCPL